MRIEPLSVRMMGDEVRRTCRVERLDGESLLREVDLWFQFPATVTAPDDRDCDSYILAMLMDAMLAGGTMVVRGSASRTLLSNLTELQAAWRKWVPQTYHTVEFVVDEVRDDGPPVAGAVCAFSGGVDATFTVWRNSQNRNGYRSQKINFCSIVHGFDIPLIDERAYDSAALKACNSVHQIGLSLVPIRTNYREITDSTWGHSYAAALVAVLSNFKNSAGTCLIGSSSPYDGVRIGRGSSPITDHLLGSGAFHVIHDGASHSRVEKLDAISNWPIGLENLRVCWQGPEKDRNCGKCEKCLRTMVSFMACGRRVPECFPASVDIVDALSHVVPTAEVVRAEWQLLLADARRNHVRAPLPKAIAGVVRRKPLLDRVLPKGSKPRRALGGLARRIRRQ